MNQVKLEVPTGVWVKASWEDYLRTIENPSYEKAKGYYHSGQMRFEMSPVGNPHSRDHFIVLIAIGLFAAIHDIDLDGHDNCTYRKTGCEEAQPDASFYIGETADAIPWEATIIDLDVYPPPPLAIEVAHTSLADDKGEKRLLYETLGVSEYWIVDVQNVQIIAFQVENGGSRRIFESQVLPGLDLAVLEEAFRRCRQSNHSKVSAWLLRQWQSDGERGANA